MLTTFQTLSRVHAILDIDDVTSMTIHDNHSLNKTFLNSTQLKPDVHYNIQVSAANNAFVQTAHRKVLLLFRVVKRSQSVKSK